MSMMVFNHEQWKSLSNTFWTTCLKRAQLLHVLSRKTHYSKWCHSAFPLQPWNFFQGQGSHPWELWYFLKACRFQPRESSDGHNSWSCFLFKLQLQLIFIVEVVNQSTFSSLSSLKLALTAMSVIAYLVVLILSPTQTKCFITFQSCIALRLPLVFSINCFSDHVDGFNAWNHMYIKVIFWLIMHYAIVMVTLHKSWVNSILCLMLFQYIQLRPVMWGATYTEDKATVSSSRRRLLDGHGNYTASVS